MEDVISTSAFLKVAAKGFCVGFFAGFGMYIIGLIRRQMLGIFSGTGGISG